MATFTEIKIPTNTDYGWAFDFFEQNSVDLPPGCALLITIQSDNHPAQWYFDRGVTGVLVNVGVENSTWDTLGIPVSRRFVLTGQSFVRGPVNNKPFNQWVPSDVELSVAAWFNARACQYITTDSDEFYDQATGGTGERYEQNSAMWVLMERRMGEEAAARGQEYYGHYGATFKPSDPTNPKLRAALASGAAMLTHLQDQTIGGGATQFPYWAENLFDHPVHCVANAYYIGSSDAHARLHELDAQLSGMRMAMTETGRNRKIMLYTEGVDNEMTGYTAFYKRTLPGGGYLLHAQWPGIDFGYMLTQYFWGFLDCDAVNGWKPDQLFGTNPNIIPPDFVNSDNVQTIKYFPEDDNQFTPQRATPATLSTRGQNPSPYPVYPIGFENSIGVAAQWIRKAYDATGTKSWKRPVLTMNGQTYTPGAGHTFLSTIYDQRLPYVRGYVNPDTGGGWMFFMYQGGKTPVTVTATLDGVTKTVRLLPGAPRFFTFTGSTTTTPVGASMPTIPAYTRLPRSGIGIFTQSTNTRDFGNGLEDKTAYENQGLINIPKSDGDYLPYIKLLRDIATANGSRAMPEIVGGYITQRWSDFKVGSSLTATWTTGNISPSNLRFLSNVFAYAHQEGMCFGLAIGPSRESGFREWIADADRVHDHSGNLSAFNDMSIAPWQLARYKNVDPGNIDTTTAAGKYLSDLKSLCHELQPYYLNGSLTYLVECLRDNMESGYNGFQSVPESTWGDWSPEEIADLQAYLKLQYNNNLTVLNNAWFGSTTGSYFSQWTNVTFPYTGNFQDFKGRRGIDCTAFREQRIADCTDAFLRIVWSELPGIPMCHQYGQPFGGQSGIVGTVDIGYFFRRHRTLELSYGYTHTIVGKVNPSPSEDMVARARYLANMLNNECGYVHTLQELSYENNASPASGRGAVDTNQQMTDFNRYATSTRIGDSSGSFVVLFNPTQWNAGDGVAAALTRWFTLNNRNTPALSIGTSSPVITITIDQMLTKMLDDGRWFGDYANAFYSNNGGTQDVKIVVQGV